MLHFDLVCSHVFHSCSQFRRGERNAFGKILHEMRFLQISKEAGTP